MYYFLGNNAILKKKKGCPNRTTFFSIIYDLFYNLPFFISSTISGFKIASICSIFMSHPVEKIQNLDSNPV